MTDHDHSGPSEFLAAQSPSLDGSMFQKLGQLQQGLPGDAVYTYAQTAFLRFRRSYGALDRSAVDKETERKVAARAAELAAALDEAGDFKDPDATMDVARALDQLSGLFAAKGV